MAHAGHDRQGDRFNAGRHSAGGIRSKVAAQESASGSLRQLDPEYVVLAVTAEEFERAAMSFDYYA